MTKELTCITINTDASFSGEHQKGGYAFYIVCNDFRIKSGGPFRADPRNSEDAEMMAIGNAIATLLRRVELPKTKLLVINSDCKSGLSKIDKPNKILKVKNRPLPRKIRGLIDELLKRIGNPKVDFRHVKAHNGHPDARSWVNDWCDKEAKRHMKESVRKMNKHGQKK